jgi:hypothetical protein
MDKYSCSSQTGCELSRLRRMKQYGDLYTTIWKRMWKGASYHPFHGTVTSLFIYFHFQIVKNMYHLITLVLGFLQLFTSKMMDDWWQGFVGHNSYICMCSNEQLSLVWQKVMLLLSLLLNPSMPALMHCTELPFFTCCQPQCTVWSIRHWRELYITPPSWEAVGI